MPPSAKASGFEERTRPLLGPSQLPKKEQEEGGKHGLVREVECSITRFIDVT